MEVGAIDRVWLGAIWCRRRAGGNRLEEGILWGSSALCIFNNSVVYVRQPVAPRSDFKVFLFYFWKTMLPRRGV